MMATIAISTIGLATLYVSFVIKHFLGDFLFQTAWMAYGKEQRENWLSPLAAHAGIHGALTLLLTLAFLPSLWWLGPVDFVIHGLIDRSKALVTRWRGLTLKDKGWWWLIGLDQALHGLTHFSYILALLIER
jgi:hypothetical protein